MNRSTERIIESLLQDPKLLPLSTFKSNKYNKYSLFPQAKTLPAFFEHNLVNDGRVVKVLKGSEGVLRGFYYQLLKLGFEIENPTVDYASLIKNVIFESSLIQYSSAPISGKRFSISQYCRIIIEFMQNLEAQVIPNCDLTIGQFPVIDEAFITVLELIIQKNPEFFSTTQKKTQKTFTMDFLLEKLCQLFSITLEMYDNCFSFSESDVFMYIEGDSEIYLAYLSEMAEVQSFTESSAVDKKESNKKGDFSSNSFIESKDYSSKNMAALDRRDNFRLSAGNVTRSRARDVPYLNRKKMNKNDEPDSDDERENSDQNRSAQYYRNTFTEGRYKSDKSLSEDDQRSDQLAFIDNKSYVSGNTVEKNVFESEEGSVRKKRSAHASEKHYSGKQRSSHNQGGGKKKYQRISEHEFEYDNSEKQSSNIEFHIEEPLSAGIPKKYEYEPKQTQSISQIGAPSLSDGRSYSLKTQSEQVSVIEYRGNFLPKKEDHINAKKFEIQEQKILESELNLSELNKSEKEKNRELNSALENAKSFESFNSSEGIKMGGKEQAEHSMRRNNVMSTDRTTYDGNLYLGEKKSIFSSLYGKANDDRNSPMHKLNTERSPFKKNFEEPAILDATPVEKDIQFFNPRKDHKHFVEGSQFDHKVKLQVLDRKNVDKQKDCNEKNESKGTFYKEFSDTKVMEAMTEPYKTKVRNTRKKFYGVRSKDFLGF